MCRVSADFEFLNCRDSVNADNLESAEPKPGSMIKSVIKCDVPKNGVPMTCGVGSNNAKASSTAIANSASFSFSQSVTVGVKPPFTLSFYSLIFLIGDERG